MAGEDPLKADLGLAVDDRGVADIEWPASGEVRRVEGKDNLRQALALRLLVGRGELTGLGHARYGSRIRDLVGEPLDRMNLELLRRHVRSALKEEPRVADVVSVVVRARPRQPGVVDVEARVRAVTGEAVDVEVALDLG
jgi:phage baseplate assembly protein W